MGSFSDYLENKILDHVVGKTDYDLLANVYLALYTAAPSDAGGGTEVSGTNYVRVECSGDWNAASSGAIDNANDITFAEAGAGGWGTITHFALLDASTNGNFLIWGALSSGKSVSEGNTVKFLVGELDITLD